MVYLSFPWYKELVGQVWNCPVNSKLQLLMCTVIAIRTEDLLFREVL